MKDREEITIFTDGSCAVKDEYLRGGFGVYIVTKDSELPIRKGYWNTTTTRMEMMALLTAIQAVNPNRRCKVQIVTDSQFIANAFKEGWIKKWRMANFRGIKNAFIWKQICYEIDIRRNMVLTVRWVRGHQKDMSDFYQYGNAVADELADYKSQEVWHQDRNISLFRCKSPNGKVKFQFRNR